LLPNTGSFKVEFVISVVALVIGLTILAITVFTSFKKRSETAKK